MTNRELTLTSGRTIRLQALQQSAVYSGLLEGLPTREMNARKLTHIVQEARARTGHEPFLIEPVQTPIEYDGKYPFGEPAELPSIACVADFVSSGKDSVHYTRLSAIWFQDDYAFPLSPEAAASLRAIDWDKLALHEEL